MLIEVNAIANLPMPGLCWAAAEEFNGSMDVRTLGHILGPPSLMRPPAFFLCVL